ncbi:hypothetical protein PF008_g20765 [Phytophthora fragariae]|uniref:Uncharacterized protein n=1 Tax=Phytophthora fragariae TaxID=53985 RepID=A0A6G0QYI8_9STRA|nr:hypothetical protein PF008_g20765 [Phytophthora fragariae]
MSFSSPIELAHFSSPPSRGPRPLDTSSSCQLPQVAYDEGAPATPAIDPAGPQKHKLASSLPSPNPAKRGKRKYPVWNDVDVADDVTGWLRLRK